MNKNKKILILLVVLIALGALFVVSKKTRYAEPQPTNTTSQGPTPEQKKQEDDANATAKKQIVEGSEQSTQTSSSTSLSANDIELSARQETNNTVTVLTKLKNYANGECKLVVSSGGKTITQTARVFYQPEFSTCAGFSVPINSVGNGTWSISLTVVSSDGNTATKTISLEVK